MTKFTVIAVNVRSEYPDPTERENEVDRYMYGRFFRLDSRETNERTRRYGHLFDLFYLVEEHYAQSIIDRLASGLLWARRASEPELEELNLR